MSCVAVIPARRAERSIRATLESLRLGNDAFVERVLVVTSSDDPTAAVVRAWGEHDGRVELVLSAAPRTAGAARNDGRAAAARISSSRCLAAAESCAGGRTVDSASASSRGRTVDSALSGRGRGTHADPLILFIDADCRLEAGGAAALAAEMERSGAVAVTSRVLGEGAVVARARHILEFKEAASRRPPPRAWLPPSTVMLCRGDGFDRAGGFPDLWPGEDLVFTQSLRDLGERVERSNDIVAVHRHPPGIAEMMRHQLRLGRTAAVARRTRPMPGSHFARSPWRATLLLPARMIRIAAWQAREGRAAIAWTLLLWPLLVAGLAAWTSGFVAGTAQPLQPAATPRHDRAAAAAVQKT